jgi:hypothetical protein
VDQRPFRPSWGGLTAGRALYPKSHLKEIHQKCSEHTLTDSSELAKHLIDGSAPESYADMLSELNHLVYTLGREVDKEGIVRVPPDRKGYYGQHDLFGPEVASAYPSCARDIQKAGSLGWSNGGKGALSKKPRWPPLFPAFPSPRTLS